MKQVESNPFRSTLQGEAYPIALFNLVDILAGDLQKKSAPEAYLIYALYDQDSYRYEVEYRA